MAVQAQVDNAAAYHSLGIQTCTESLTGTNLGGLTLTPGVYCFSSAAALTGILTLNAQNNSNALFIFQIGSTLTTASGSSVLVINGGSECNVFWQVVTSATLDTNTAFAGNIFALDSITLDTSASVSGRVLAQTGAVAMDTNKVDSSMCQSGTTSTTTTTVTSTVTAPATTVTSTITSPTTTTVTFNQTSTTTETSTITSLTTTTITLTPSPVTSTTTQTVTSTTPPVTSIITQTVTSTETSTVPTTATVTSTVMSPTTTTVTAAQTTTTVTSTQTSTTTATSTIPTTTTVTSTQISPTTQTVTTTVTSTVATPTTTTVTATQTVASSATTVTSTIISPITVTATVTETQQYTSTQTVTASSTNPCSQTLGTSMLTVKSIATNGTTIYGYEVEAYCQGSHIVFGFTPVTLTLNNNEQYTVTIDQNYGSRSFAYWQNSGSALPTTSVTMSSNTSLTAVYNCRNVSSWPIVFVQTLDQNGNVITGYYVRLVDNGQEINDAYSPATFQLIDGQTYSIAAERLSLLHIQPLAGHRQNE